MTVMRFLKQNVSASFEDFHDSIICFRFVKPLERLAKYLFKNLYDNVGIVVFACFRIVKWNTTNPRQILHQLSLATLFVPTPLVGGVTIYSNGFFLFREFWPTDIFIVEKCARYH